MLQAALWTLRQRRYAALAAGMFFLAVLCVVAGTWQVARFEQSVRDNNALIGNAHAAAVPLTASLVPLVGSGKSPGRDAIRFRTVTASGTYLAGSEQLVRDQSLDGISGYYALTPFRTSTGVLLVVRGFVAANIARDGASTPPATVTAPPSGAVLITARLQTGASTNDGARDLGNGEIESVNPASQAARLGAPVYDGYATLNANQPGTAGLSALPDPDLSNPAGGAYEWQHFAYIIQWYLFALLALAAPFVIGRHEVRDAQQRFLGIEPGEDLGMGSVSQHDQRPQLTDGAATGAIVALRGNDALARVEGPSPEQWQRAALLADRYGRSLGRHQPPLPDQQPSSTEGAAPRVDHRPRPPSPRIANGIPSSANRPHRSYDAYHGSYNDYLWELGLADGSTPAVFLAPAEDRAGDLDAELDAEEDQ